MSKPFYINQPLTAGEDRVIYRFCFYIPLDEDVRSGFRFSIWVRNIGGVYTIDSMNMLYKLSSILCINFDTERVPDVIWFDNNRLGGPFKGLSELISNVMRQHDVQDFIAELVVSNSPEVSECSDDIRL